MSKQLQIVHEGYEYNKDIIAMTIPLFVMAFFFYGPRVIVLALVGILTARIADRLAGALRARKQDKTDISSVTISLLIVLMMPATVPIKIVVAAVLVGVLIAKEAFGGYQSYPFNPAAVGFCVAAVSWPDQMLRYPMPVNWVFNMPQNWQQIWDMWSFKDVILMEGPSYVLKNGGLPNIDLWNLLLGNHPGLLGITPSLVLIACGIYLYVRKRLPLAAPLSFLGIIAVISFVFPRYSEISFLTWPGDWLVRLQVVKFELLSGLQFFAAVFLVNEPGTLPKNTVSRIVYGLILGFTATMFRYFGTYELGTCFAIILVNSISGFFDRAIANVTSGKKGVAAQ